METLANLWGVLTNLAISLGYVGIGLYVAPRFRFGRDKSGGARIAKWSGISFFVTCAMTHLDLAFHAYSGTPIEFDSWSHILVCTVQALSAPTFLVFASIFLNIRIEGKKA